MVKKKLTCAGKVKVTFNWNNPNINVLCVTSLLLRITT